MMALQIPKNVAFYYTWVEWNDPTTESNESDETGLLLFGHEKD